ncbi:hypothetical protein [Pedobacter sp.]
MRKSFLLYVLALATCVFSASLSVKAQSFTKESSIISAGIGLGSSLWLSGGTGRPAISVNYEKGMWPVGDKHIISLGGYLGNTGYKSSGASSGYTWESKWNFTVVGARSAFHYGGLNNDKLDLYGGVMLSYNIVSYKYTDNDPSWDYGNDTAASGIGFTGYVGGRYYFTPKLGAFAEVGYGVSTLSLGLSLKLK